MPPDLTLSIDVGTGSVRAGLVDRVGRVLAIAARSTTRSCRPSAGPSSGRPTGGRGWSPPSGRLNEVEGGLERIGAVAGCGQMHGTVLIDSSGALTRETAPLWNDKRTAGLVASFEAE